MKKHRIANIFGCAAIFFLVVRVQSKQIRKPVLVKPDSVVAVETELAKAGIINKAKVPVNSAPIKITYGVSTHQNKRDYQEDRFAHAMVDGGDWFGVYDGHGGFQVSGFLAETLHKNFAQTSGSVQQKFQKIFAQAERGCLKFWPKQGSTALVTYIDKNKTLHCAWVGDTRAVLECNNEVCFVTNDHKPDRADEKERIEKAGGMVYKQGAWRVKGLAVSRSIGDLPSKMGAEGQIIAVPEYAEVQLSADNHFLILATDGLWDVIKNEKAVKMVSEALRNKIALNDIAKQLQDAAIKKGSGDNITVCVVKFDTNVNSTESSDSMMKKFWNWVLGRK